MSGRTLDHRPRLLGAQGARRAKRLVRGDPRRSAEYLLEQMVGCLRLATPNALICLAERLEQVPLAARQMPGFGPVRDWSFQES